MDYLALSQTYPGWGIEEIKRLSARERRFFLESAMKRRR